MEYVFFILCILLFVLFGYYIMHRIDSFLSSGDFKFYSDEDATLHKKSNTKRKKNSRK